MFKPRRFVKTFKPRFAPQVKDELKLQTMRPRTKGVMPRPGDIIDCRMWSGKPYRSKMIKLCEGRITNVAVVKIESRRTGCPDIWVHCWLHTEESFACSTAAFVSECRAAGWLQGVEIEDFARADGFDTATELCQWLQAEHGLPFEGILIQWEPLTKAQKGGQD